MAERIWNNETIKMAIKEVMDYYEIDRMPSKSEIEFVRNDCALSNAICKRGGFEHFANLLGLEMKKSDTAYGIKYERIAMDKLIDLGYSVQETSARYPYDLLVNHKVKVDVKVGKKLKWNGGYYTFNLQKPQQTCDVYIAYCVDDGEIKKTYVIPSNILSGMKQLSLGIVESKYDCYLDNWNVIDKINSAFRSFDYEWEQICKEVRDKWKPQYMGNR